MYSIFCSIKNNLQSKGELIDCVHYVISYQQLKFITQITVNLTDGRPGAGVFSPALLEFTKARFIRLRLQKFAIHHEDGNGYDYAVRVNETTANQVS